MKKEYRCLVERNLDTSRFFTHFVKKYGSGRKIIITDYYLSTNPYIRLRKKIEDDVVKYYLIKGTLGNKEIDEISEIRFKRMKRDAEHIIRKDFIGKILYEGETLWTELVTYKNKLYLSIELETDKDNKPLIEVADILQFPNPEFFDKPLLEYLLNQG